MGVGCPGLCSPRRVPPPPSLRTRPPLRQPKSARSVTAASVAAALPHFQPGAAMHPRFLHALSLPHPCFFCRALCRAFFPPGAVRYSRALCFFGGACASAILHTTHANRLTPYNVAEDSQRPTKKKAPCKGCSKTHLSGLSYYSVTGETAVNEQYSWRVCFTLLIVR